MRKVAALITLLITLPLAFGTELLVSSYNNGHVLRYDLVTGNFLGVHVAAGTAGLIHPEGLAYGPDGNLYVSSEKSNPNSILRFHPNSGQPIGTGVFATGFGPWFQGGDGIPRGITFGPNNDLFVANDWHQVRRYDGQTGQFLSVFATTNLVRAEQPVFGPDGNLYVTDRDADQVLRYNGLTGQLIGQFIAGGPLDKPEGIVFGPDGNVYITSSNTNEVLRYSSTGQFMNVFVATGSGGLNIPDKLLFGPDGHLYVSSWATDRILKYDGQTGAFLNALQVTPMLDGPTYLLLVPEPSTLFLVAGAALLILRRR